MLQKMNEEYFNLQRTPVNIQGRNKLKNQVQSQ